MPNTCVMCAYWQHEGKIQGIIRHGGKCKLNDKEARMDDKCILWKICSPNQLEARKEAGLVQEVAE